MRVKKWERVEQTTPKKKPKLAFTMVAFIQCRKYVNPNKKVYFVEKSAEEKRKTKILRIVKRKQRLKPSWKLW